MHLQPHQSRIRSRPAGAPSCPAFTFISLHGAGAVSFWFTDAVADANMIGQWKSAVNKNYFASMTRANIHEMKKGWQKSSPDIDKYPLEKIDLLTGNMQRCRNVV